MRSAQPTSTRAAKARRAPAPAPGPTTQRPPFFPYEYAATFAIDGRPGNIVQAAIAVSVDAAFVAVGLSYGFEEDRGRDLLVSQPLANPTFSAGDVTLGQIPAAGLVEGVRVNPAFIPLLFPQSPAGAPRTDPVIQGSLGVEATGRFLQRVKAPEEISFLFSMVDTASGRELQDQPTLNLASLGAPDGKRPFRPLARPLTFLPRSTLRLQIVERSTNVQGTLFIVLYGYKLDLAACGPRPNLALGARMRPPPPPPGSRVVPFDYVSSLALTGRTGNLVQDEVPINSEGNFVVTSIGYGLQVDTTEVRPARGALPSTTGPDIVDLRQVPLRAFNSKALIGGFRIRPSYLRFALLAGGQLNAGLPIELLDRIFEPLNRPGDVSFRYMLFDSGAGRDLQSQPIYNVAGLGTATGERPFKMLARPLALVPRSTLRVQVEERFGVGQLHIVFQGYKLLGAPAQGGR